MFVVESQYFLINKLPMTFNKGVYASDLLTYATKLTTHP